MGLGVGVGVGVRVRVKVEMAVTQEVAEGLAVVLDVGRAHQAVEDALLHLVRVRVRVGVG